MERAFLGLGSNLGDRKANVDNSIELFTRQPEVNLLEKASNYETEPVGPVQPWFINTAIEIETSLSPEGLLDWSKEVEKRIGRIESIHWGPRLVDLDLLLYDELVTDTEELRLPHPEMAKRRFVLLPLIELEDDLVHPELGTPLKELLTKTEENKKVIKTL
ncbi:MAG: 2-amino-4-hydroxy-6-hydroxymethyldihydropteridine diphosphokinase [Candidatus Acetothermia bacterium]